MMRTLARFFSELRRRHVFKVAAGYAIVGWVVIQAAELLVPQLLLPGWLIRAIILIVMLGFPVALVLAWAYDVMPDGIQATGRQHSDRDSGAAPVTQVPRSDDARGASAVHAAGHLRWFAAVVVLLVLAGAAAWVALRDPPAVRIPGGAVLVEHLDSLAEAGRFEEGFELVNAATAQGESVSARLQARFADRLTVITEPAGARVTARRFETGEDGKDAPADWALLGMTPIHGRLMPRGDYLLRIERDGFAPVERLASTSSLRAGVPPGDVPETVLHLRLLPADDIADGMVSVPGGPYAIVSRNLQGLMADLDDFFLGRYSVTNGEFTAFINAGGYVNRSHWTELYDDPEVGDPDTLLRRFVDRTGLAGPREWSGQTVPHGREGHPVTGVTWFEASAYCRFRDARLPTFYEWEKAARDGQISHADGVYMPWGIVKAGQSPARRANFQSAGTMPVDAHPFGISPYGAYDMAGNAKEWLANAIEDGRAVTGGSWEDPMYLFSEVGSVDPASSSPSIGFRCARPARGEARPGRGQGEEGLPSAVKTPVYEPVDDATFRGLLAHYTYDRRPVRGEVLERVETPGWVRERIRFEGPAGTSVLAYLYLPAVGRAPYQTLVFVPGSGVFFGTSLPEATEWLLGPVVRSGRAIFTVVMEGMTERPFPAGVSLGDPASVRFRDQMVRHATEMRMGIDYLETRAEVDMEALVYVAVSWGAGSRLGFAAVEPRFRATIFIGGGIDERLQPTLPEASNFNFAPRVTAPVLLLNGRRDEEHPWRTRALPLWELLPEPRELVLVNDAGHVPSLEDRIPAMLDFLDRMRGGDSTRAAPLPTGSQSVRTGGERFSLSKPCRTMAVCMQRTGRLAARTGLPH